MPRAEELAAAYASAYACAGHIDADPEAAVRATQPYRRAILRAIEARRVEGPVAEIGAGWGGLARLLTAKGFSYEGVEPSHAMARYCREQGLPVIEGDIWSLPGPEYSALLLSNVFEHLTEHDAWLTRASGLLRQGGAIITTQPTARFATFMGSVARLGQRNVHLPELHRTFAPPWHTVIFSIPGMERLMARHGFDLIDVRPMPQGREQGLAAIQWSLEQVNKIGWAALGGRWPLIPGHLFVFEKSRADAGFFSV